MWIIAIFFTIQASIVLLAIGLFIYLCLIPVVEASRANDSTNRDTLIRVESSALPKASNRQRHRSRLL